jgi:hypothetical protein
MLATILVSCGPAQPTQDYIDAHITLVLTQDLDPMDVTLNGTLTDENGVSWKCSKRIAQGQDLGWQCERR